MKAHSPLSSRGAEPARAVVVTGAGSGIGRRVTELLIDRGYLVFATAVSPREAAELSSLDPRVRAHVVDVRDEAGVDSSATSVAEDLDGARLAGLLNVAGIVMTKPILDVDGPALRNILAVNAVGTHLTTRAFVPLLRAQPGQASGGRIINVTSAAGRRTLPFTGAYSASKFAAEALSNATRLELRPFAISLSVVAPAQVKTPMQRQILDELECGSTFPEYAEPLRRMVSRTRNSFDHGLTADRIARALLTALEAKHPKARYDLHSNYFRDVYLMRRAPVAVRDWVLSKSLGFDRTNQP